MNREMIKGSDKFFEKKIQDVKKFFWIFFGVQALLGVLMAAIVCGFSINREAITSPFLALVAFMALCSFATWLHSLIRRNDAKNNPHLLYSKHMDNLHRTSFKANIIAFFLGLGFMLIMGIEDPAIIVVWTLGCFLLCHFLATLYKTRKSRLEILAQKITERIHSVSQGVNDVG
jgi:hypothetical protein